MTKQAIQRLMRIDFRMFEKLEINKLGIYVKFDESNLLRGHAMIVGPPETPYEDTLMFFRIEIPTDYPWNPPHITYVSTSKLRIHPNLYVGRSHHNYQGKVCLSVINTWSGPKWSSVMSVASVLISLQSLLDAHPLRNEPGYEKVEGDRDQVYNMMVEHDMIQSYMRHKDAIRRSPQGAEAVAEAEAVEGAGTGLAEGDSEVEDSVYPYTLFREIMESHFTDSGPRVLTRLETLCSQYPKKLACEIGVYRIKDTIDFPRLRDRWNSL